LFNVSAKHHLLLTHITKTTVLAATKSNSDGFVNNFSPMDPFYVAVSLFRRRKYDLCIDKCNELLLKNPTHQGPWELKMRAMTQRVYIDDIDIDDGMPDEVVDSRTGTARPNTSLKTGDSHPQFVDGRPRTSTGRPMTGVVSIVISSRENYNNPDFYSFRPGQERCHNARAPHRLATEQPFEPPADLAPPRM
jgi:hypothetical protein